MTKAEHLWDPNESAWKNFEEKMTRLRGMPQWICNLTTEFLEMIAQAEKITWDSQIDPNLWCWSNEIPMDGGFLLPNAKVYSLLLHVLTKWEYLNKKWVQVDTKVAWRKWWKNL